jgi:hypothetical protein
MWRKQPCFSLVIADLERLETHDLTCCACVRTMSSTFLPRLTEDKILGALPLVASKVVVLPLAGARDWSMVGMRVGRPGRG